MPMRLTPPGDNAPACEHKRTVPVGMRSTPGAIADATHELCEDCGATRCLVVPALKRLRATA